MPETSKPQAQSRWHTAVELPADVFAVWRKPDQALSPVAVVATIEPDGAPHTAPFGSLRAITPRLMRFISLRYHATFTNLLQDDRVMVAMLAPPNIAVSAYGRARVVKEHMEHDENYALIEIDIQGVKNDMARTVVIDSPITILAVDQYKDWFTTALSELEAS